MKIKPIASDSLGIRSMATYVETKDCKILIDPSAAITPKRYGLEPLKEELDALDNTKKRIKSFVKKCDILTISHYHYDHFDTNIDLYKGKKVFAKDISKNINKSQKQRGTDLKKSIEKICELYYCDDKTFNYGDTRIVFSPPFFHGPENIRLGFVIMTSVYDGEMKIIHASDVQGPVTTDAKDYILTQKPDLLIIDGPPTHMLGFRFSKKNLQKASDNLLDIIKKLNCQIILDHHLLRDLKYKENFSEPYKVGKEKVKTFAEYLGKENNTLEAHRKILWGK